MVCEVEDDDDVEYKDETGVIKLGIDKRDSALRLLVNPLFGVSVVVAAVFPL